MNFSEQFTAIINTLCEKFGIVIDWTSSNLLPYFKELVTRFIKWEISTSIMYIVIWGIVFISFLILSIVFTKKANKQMEEDEDEKWDYDWHWKPWLATISIACAIVFGMVFIGVTGVQVYDIIEVTYITNRSREVIHIHQHPQLRILLTRIVV